ncbi:MAG: hypothetical protein JRH16_10070 [Deltaproteobacteria bacterium]|nr:hypothetical protein [Deltaproteobacteria bacterium]MBW2359640.1 hypothetical protein [Deltaproteobacteria bacterium]
MAASRWPIVLLAVLAAALLAQPANAEPDQVPPSALAPVRLAEILKSLDRPQPGESWLAHHMARVGISGKHGLTYTRRLDRGEKGMRLRFGGPVVGRKARLGLSFEIRF